ncbi:hypothetical protein Btru_033332 [Bulinus truncatus]|nr:hypothetical protein Btru_033332 [Bulinus truncatus]
MRPKLDPLNVYNITCRTPTLKRMFICSAGKLDLDTDDSFESDSEDSCHYSPMSTAHSRRLEATPLLIFRHVFQGIVSTSNDIQKFGQSVLMVFFLIESVELGQMQGLQLAKVFSSIFWSVVFFTWFQDRAIA